MTSSTLTAVVDLKGGSQKTITTAYGLHVCAELDGTEECIGIDADGENQSLDRWQHLAEWQIGVIGMAVPNMHKQLPGILGNRFRRRWLDTPPMKERAAVVRSAILVATHVVVPIAPTSSDFDQLPKTYDFIKEAIGERADGSRPVVRLLLTKASKRLVSTQVWRTVAEDAGWHVLDTIIPVGERYAQAFGRPIKNASKGPYGDAVAELLSLKGAE